MCGYRNSDRSRAICMVQDSKRAFKTYRNNLFSSARLLSFGNHTAIYQHNEHIQSISDWIGKMIMKQFADVLQYLANHPWSIADTEKIVTSYPVRLLISQESFCFPCRHPLRSLLPWIHSSEACKHALVKLARLSRISLSLTSST